ncbi:MAG TPA: hypothetical protein VE174_05145 [Actinomycetota bacterium]|nr:hypothetical protein [Actinomycetota bacterium]
MSFDQHPTPAAMDHASGAQLLALGRSLLSGAAAPPGTEVSTGSSIVVASLSRPAASAVVAGGQGPTVAAAMAVAIRSLRERATQAGAEDGTLRIDIVRDRGYQRISESPGRVLIDPSAEGVWFPSSGVILLPDELMSRRLIGDDKIVRRRRLLRYVLERDSRELPVEPEWSYVPIRFDTFVEEGSGAIGLVRGNVATQVAGPDQLMESAVSGGEYLLRHQFDNGEFGYTYKPWSNTYDDDYNLLRHAGTTYALLELYRATRDERFRRGGENGIEALLRYARPPRADDPKASFEAIVGPEGAAKVGGAGLAILALTEYEKATGDARWQERALNLAGFLLHQLELSGHFVSKYFYEEEGDNLDSIYYPGEAILALCRLYRLRPDQRLLEAATRAARWLITVRDRKVVTDRLPHDHWLLMGLNELVDLTSDELFQSHAFRIANAIVAKQHVDPPHPDWAGGFYVPPRSTPTATRSEALVAASELAERSGMDRKIYIDVLAKSTRFQRRCQFDRFNTWFLPRPDLALGGFREHLTSWEVRIDYVQHNASSLLGFRSLLLGER